MFIQSNEKTKEQIKNIFIYFQVFFSFFLLSPFLIQIAFAITPSYARLPWITKENKTS